MFNGSFAVEFNVQLNYDGALRSQSSRIDEIELRLWFLLIWQPPIHIVPDVLITIDGFTVGGLGYSRNAKTHFATAVKTVDNTLLVN